MILNLVDRQGGADGGGQLFVGDRWARLNRLAKVVGMATWPVDLVLLDDKAMARLNRRFRGKDDVTDVLSFSYLEFDRAGRPDLAAGQCHAAADIWLADEPVGSQDGGAQGELVLAPAFIAKRCVAHGWSLETETCLLVVHGCLHLVGWDHEDAPARRVMQEHETTILAGEGLPHPLHRRS